MGKSFLVSTIDREILLLFEKAQDTWLLDVSSKARRSFSVTFGSSFIFGQRKTSAQWAQRHLAVRIMTIAGLQQQQQQQQRTNLHSLSFELPF